jgi:outer membrane protein insertion porin family
MRIKLLIILMTLPLLHAAAQVKTTNPVDTVYNPNIIYTGMPNTYEIAGIKVSGVPNYEDVTVINYSGLNIGDRIEIPGTELTSAAKRFR